jgi:hypothetical protein
LHSVACRSTEDVEVSDVSLIDFIGVKGKFAVWLPHTAGRYQAKSFRKVQVRALLSDRPQPPDALSCSALFGGDECIAVIGAR